MLEIGGCNTGAEFVTIFNLYITTCVVVFRYLQLPFLYQTTKSSMPSRMVLLSSYQARQAAMSGG